MTEDGVPPNVLAQEHARAARTLAGPWRRCAPPDPAVFGRYYLPEDTVHATGNSQYPGWMGSGRLTVTQGNVIDCSWIEADLVDCASRFAIQAVAFDPFLVRLDAVTPGAWYAARRWRGACWACSRSPSAQG